MRHRPFRLYPNRNRSIAHHQSAVTGNLAILVLQLFSLFAQLVGVAVGFIFVYAKQLITGRKHKVKVTLTKSGEINMRAK